MVLDTSLDFVFGDASLTVNSFIINGLDSFYSIDVFDVIGDQTIYNKFGLESLKLSTEVMIDVPFDSFETSD